MAQRLHTRSCRGGFPGHISTRNTFRCRRTAQDIACRGKRAGCTWTADSIALTIASTYIRTWAAVIERCADSVTGWSRRRVLILGCIARRADRSTAWGVCSGRIINPRRARRADPVTCGRRRSTQIGAGRTCITDGRTARPFVAVEIAPSVHGLVTGRGRRSTHVGASRTRRDRSTGCGVCRHRIMGAFGTRRALAIAARGRSRTYIATGRTLGQKLYIGINPDNRGTTGNTRCLDIGLIGDGWKSIVRTCLCTHRRHIARRARLSHIASRHRLDAVGKLGIPSDIFNIAWQAGALHELPRRRQAARGNPQHAGSQRVTGNTNITYVRSSCWRSTRRDLCRHHSKRGTQSYRPTIHKRLLAAGSLHGLIWVSTPSVAASPPTQVEVTYSPYSPVFGSMNGKSHAFETVSLPAKEELPDTQISVTNDPVDGSLHGPIWVSAPSPPRDIDIPLAQHTSQFGYQHQPSRHHPPHRERRQIR